MSAGLRVLGSKEGQSFDPGPFQSVVDNKHLSMQKDSGLIEGGVDAHGTGAERKWVEVGTIAPSTTSRKSRHEVSHEEAGYIYCKNEHSGIEGGLSHALPLLLGERECEKEKKGFKHPWHSLTSNIWSFGRLCTMISLSLCISNRFSPCGQCTSCHCVFGNGKTENESIPPF